MIEVERRKTISVAASTVQAILSDVENLRRLLPHVERVEAQGQNENRARVSIWLRAGRLGLQRIDGEARVLPNGLRFVAVEPAQIDARWTIVQRGESVEVSVRLGIEPGGALKSLSRWLPRRLVEQRLGQELDACLDALEMAARS